MKEKWKNIFLAIVISGLITGIWAIPQIQFLMSYENTLNNIGFKLLWLCRNVLNVKK